MELVPGEKQAAEEASAAPFSAEGADWKALRHKFLGKLQTVKVVLHANNAAESPPPYYLALPRGGYLHFYTEEVRKLFEEFYPFGGLSCAKLQHNDCDLPLELPFGVLRDAYLQGELPCIVLRCASQADELTPHYVDHFKQSLKEAAFVKSGSGDAFRHFSGPRTWREMFEALGGGDYARLDAAQQPLLAHFSGDFCPVRVLWKGQRTVSGRRALRSETLEEFMWRSYPNLAQRCAQASLGSLLRVFCGGIELPLRLRVGAVEEAFRFGDLFVYLTLQIL